MIVDALEADGCVELHPGTRWPVSMPAISVMGLGALMGLGVRFHHFAPLERKCNR